MKIESKKTSGFSVPRPPALEAVLARLTLLSLKSEFTVQRNLWIALALKPYLQEGAARLLAPLDQESELANLALLYDFYPEDGQLTLIEQLRDVITEHIPQEERVWLDPLKHSYLDLLQVAAHLYSEGAVRLRSLGDGTEFQLPSADFANGLPAGTVLLTRVVREPSDSASGKAVWAGGIVLDPADGTTLYEKTREWERRMEMFSGELVLGEWQEFTKRFGHILLWVFAEMRFAALMDAVAHIRYRNLVGMPYLYAMALYDHHEYRLFVDGVSRMDGFEPETPAVGMKGEAGADAPRARRWVQRGTTEDSASILSRLIVTPTQLIAECDSPERLDYLKHRLASTFGFSLHFRGETFTLPPRRLSVEQLSSRQVPVIVTAEEELAMLRIFLETAYLEWSDQPHMTLGGQTPRHAVASFPRCCCILDQ